MKAVFVSNLLIAAVAAKKCYVGTTQNEWQRCDSCDAVGGTVAGNTCRVPGEIWSRGSCKETINDCCDGQTAKSGYKESCKKNSAIAYTVCPLYKGLLTADQNCLEMCLESLDFGIYPSEDKMLNRYCGIPEKPTPKPTHKPTEKPTEEPTEAPEPEPTEKPTEAEPEPTDKPTEAEPEPTEKPTEAEPNVKPTEPGRRCRHRASHHSKGKRLLKQL